MIHFVLQKCYTLNQIQTFHSLTLWLYQTLQTRSLTADSCSLMNQADRCRLGAALHCSSSRRRGTQLVLDWRYTCFQQCSGAWYPASVWSIDCADSTTFPDPAGFMLVRVTCWWNDVVHWASTQNYIRFDCNYNKLCDSSYLSFWHRSTVAALLSALWTTRFTELPAVTSFLFSSFQDSCSHRHGVWFESMTVHIHVSENQTISQTR